MLLKIKITYQFYFKTIIILYSGTSSDCTSCPTGSFRDDIENECPCDEDTYTCSEAASNGHLDCLKYLHENGYPLAEDTCSLAALGGYLNCLKYAHENGCPWDKTTISGARENNHLDCLDYAIKNGCPEE